MGTYEHRIARRDFEPERGNYREFRSHPAAGETVDMRSALSGRYLAPMHLQKQLYTLSVASRGSWESRWIRDHSSIGRSRRR